jgi:hypothetical protein
MYQELDGRLFTVKSRTHGGTMNEPRSTISRRGMLAGLGVAGGAAVLARAAPASATPGPTTPAQPLAAPAGLAPISSAPEAGVSYQFRSWDDFFAEDDLLYGRRFGGGGVYTSAASDYLAATFELPPGAVLHDLEWYVSNSVSMNVYANVWQSSQAVLDTFWSASIAAGSGITAHKFAIPANVNGPYPHGTRLMVAASTASNGTTQINGVRAGFVNAPTSTVLLPSPIRAYDSRNTGGPISAGHSRTVTVAGHVPAGAIGAIVNLTVTHTVSSGYLKLYAHGSPLPPTSAINWFGPGQTLANQATTALSLGREMTVTGGTGSTDFIVDLVGYLV